MDDSKLLNDSELLYIHELRDPYIFFRFSRLRLSVRLAARAPVELLALLFAARSDRRAWLQAREDDIMWLGKRMPESTFTVSERFAFGR